MPSKPDPEELRRRLIGLGERSIKKSYYPELKRKRGELERFRDIMDRAGDAIFVLDTGGRILDLNQTGSDFLGRTRKELLGHDLRGLVPTSILYEALGPGFSLLEDQGQIQVEVYLPQQDGTGRVVDFSFSLGRLGRERYLVAVGRDATERKQAEEELRRARDRAEAASRAKSEFLANISHELRTPLSGVLGMLQVLQATPLPEGSADYLDCALSSARGLLSVLDDILDLSVIERGELLPREKEFNPVGLIREVMTTFRAQASHNDLVLTEDLDPSLPETVVGDDGRLRQVLFNLVGNAVKFTPEGSITVSVCLLAPLSPHGRARLLVSVADTGIGIPEDRIQSIFEPFTQADGTLSRQYGGMGLGLSVVRRLVQRLGGVLNLESEPDKGTTIHFTMPVADPGAARRKPVADGVPGDDGPEEENGRCRVLVVDDDPALQLLLQSLLTRHGSQVTLAHHGREALDQLAKQPFDLVFMDLRMPVMDGLETARAIRSGQEPGVPRDVPLVALTAMALEGDRELALAAGMDDYLTKPIDEQELLRVSKRIKGRCVPPGSPNPPGK